MRVSRSGYYEWLDRPMSNRDKEEQKLIKIITNIFIQNRQIYGIRRISKKLAENQALTKKLCLSPPLFNHFFLKYC